MSGFMEQFGDYEQPEIEFSQTPFANRADTTKPYINKDKVDYAQEKVGKHTQSERKDLSYYAFNRFVIYAQPIDSFEQSINIIVNRDTLTADNFDDKRAEYIAVYRREMNKG